MFCPKCGTQNDDAARFCSACGAVFEDAAPQPQQPQYQAPMQNTYPTAQPVAPAKGFAITSMILGIVSLALFCIWYLSIPCAIVGAALGGIAFSKAKAVGIKNGMATAGIVCSCIALGLAILFIILAAIGIASANSVFY